MKEKVTIIDVARRAGVSQGTVSKIFNGNDGSEETRSKVLAAAEELGYRPNLFAQAMRASSNNCIGILVSKITVDDPWLEKLMPSMSASIADSNYRCMVDFWNP